jgi:hypothetical protein
MRYISVLFVFISCLSYSQVNHWETVVYDNDNWSYIVPNTTTSASWISPTFSVASWSVGQGGFGFGDGDDNTTLPTSSISVYHRIDFNIVDVSVIVKAVLNIDYDDGYVAYLNGVEISRNGLSGTGQPTFNQLANISHEAALYQGNYPDQISFTTAQISSLLVNGLNTLAIETHNQNTNSSDLTSRAFFSLGISDASNNYGPTPTWFTPPPFEFYQSNLPIVVLNTLGQSIPDEPKIDANMGIIYNGPGVVNTITDAPNEFFGEIGIEKRGSSSNSFPAASYSVETRGPDPHINYNVSLFDWPIDNDWILYAPYTDKSMIRNVLTYHIGNQTGRWAPRTQLCELLINDEYMGVYVLMERIKQSPGRVNINPLLPADTSNNELTGGYVIKIDKTTGNEPIIWNSPFLSAAPGAETIGFQLHEPSPFETNNIQRQYIEDYVTEWETALAGPSFTDPITGYRNYIDIPSFIDFFLINEVSKNVDGYRISTYLTKHRTSEGGKLEAGPLWDFNLAFGNANYCQGGLTSGWEINFNSICGGQWQNPFWWTRMLQDPGYAHDVKCRWLELRQGILSTNYLMNYIDSLSAVLDEPSVRHFSRWPILGTYVWPNNFIGNTFQEEIDYMKTWLTSRLAWMDANMFGSCDDLGISEENSLNTACLYPNPTDGRFTITCNGVFNPQKAIITNAIGQVISSVLHSSNGPIEINLEGQSNGVYFIQLFTTELNYQTLKLVKQ